MGKYSAAVHEYLYIPARVSITAGEAKLAMASRERTPEPVNVQLLIDTGSRRSTLTRAVLDRAGSRASVGQVHVATSLAAGRAELFWVRLEFPDAKLTPIPMLSVVRLDLPSVLHSFHGVLGRDVLRRWESMLYEGRRGRLTIRDEPSRLRRWLVG